MVCKDKLKHGFLTSNFEGFFWLKVCFCNGLKVLVGVNINFIILPTILRTEMDQGYVFTNDNDALFLL